MAGPASTDVDLAIYHLVIDVLKSTVARSAAFVEVTLGGGGDLATRVLIKTPGNDPERVRALTARSEDRLVALGGRLTITSTAASLTVEGEIPCAS